MASASDVKTQELTAIIREIHNRVRSRYPEGNVSGTAIPLPDLLPVLHARDAAEGKVAAIGSVNPRAGGPLNSIIQAIKRQIARTLGWFVRDQIEYNRALLRCVEEILTSLNEVNRTFSALGEELPKLHEKSDVLLQEAAELKDVRTHWIRWREEWERKLFESEIQQLKAISELQASYQHRTALSETNFRDSLRIQHAEFAAAIKVAIEDVHKRFWEDLEKVRLDYERLIHSELRVTRQKAFAQAAIEPAAGAGAQPGHTPPKIDYARLEDRFRGSEEYVRNNQRFYLPFFEGRHNVLDIGCGRGEFLALMKENGVPARGIDLDPESVALCRSKGYDAEHADLFQYLDGLADASLGGIFCAQVVEHLSPEQVPEFIKLAAAKLARGGVLAVETPNPECLAIFATHFYLDPTHTRPVPPNLLAFYFEEFGFGLVEVHRLAPAIDSMPSLGSLPEDFRTQFFGSLDYSITAKRL